MPVRKIDSIDLLCYTFAYAAGIVSGDTLTADPEAPAAPPIPQEKESADDIEKRARKPPAEGPCKMCKEMKMLNRLLLCYPCWLKDMLHKDSGGEWLPGDPHPKSCDCDAPGGCSSKSIGN